MELWPFSKMIFLIFSARPLPDDSVIGRSSSGHTGGETMLSSQRTTNPTTGQARVPGNCLLTVIHNSGRQREFTEELPIEDAGRLTHQPKIQTRPHSLVGGFWATTGVLFIVKQARTSGYPSTMPYAVSRLGEDPPIGSAVTKILGLVLSPALVPRDIHAQPLSGSAWVFPL
jgi:hypothetical protein